MERDITQEQVAERTGIGQTTLSAYERGKSAPTALALNQIERACGRPDGWIVIQAGLIAEVRTVPEAIAVAPELDDNARSTLIRAYGGVVDHVRKVRGDELRDGGHVGP